MALGKRSSEQIPQIGGSPRPPVPRPTPAPPAGIQRPPASPAPTPLAGAAPTSGMLAALDVRLQEIQATVAKLAERTAAAPIDTALDPEVAAASRTLQMAKKTADASLAEANEEATAIIREAHETAERELAGQRQQLADESRSWENRRHELTQLFQSLDRQLTEHQRAVDSAREIISRTLANDLGVNAPAVHHEEPPALDADPVVPERAPLLAEPTFETPTDTAESASDVPPSPFSTADEPEAVIDLTESQAPQPQPSAVQHAPHEAPTPSASTGEQTFGTPPPSPFYPWENESGEAQGDTNDGQGAFPADPPVQRRGLFGH